MMNQKEFGEYLRKYLDEHGIRYNSVAEKLGMSRQVFNSRLLGEGWKLDEALTVIKVLDLPRDLFL